jgi:hypothetical protein
VAGSPRKNRPGAVVVSSPTRQTPELRDTIKQTAATTAKRHTRKRVSSATSWRMGITQGRDGGSTTTVGRRRRRKQHQGDILCQSSNMEHLQQTRMGGEYMTGKADNAQLNPFCTSNGG